MDGRNRMSGDSKGEESWRETKVMASGENSRICVSREDIWANDSVSGFL